VSVPHAPAFIHYVDTAPDRRPPPKKNGASVGEMVDPFLRKRHWFESEPERAVLTVLMTQWWVAGIQEQVTVAYRWKGRKRSYTFDLIVDTHDRRRIAYAVKRTEADLLKDDTVEILKATSAQHGAEVADEYRVVTYESLDPTAVVNGRIILRCGRDHDAAAQDRVGETLKRLGSSVTLAEIGTVSGLGQRGLRAAIALIRSGILRCPPGERLALNLPLENRGSLAAGSR
jgi:hypothetical protein